LKAPKNGFFTEYLEGMAEHYANRLKDKYSPPLEIKELYYSGRT
jgi:hypothetical protein